MLCFALAILSACTGDAADTPITISEGMTKVNGSVALAWAKFCDFMDQHFGPVFRVVKYISKTISVIFRTLSEDVKETAKILRCLFANAFKKKTPASESSVSSPKTNIEADVDENKVDEIKVEDNVETPSADAEVVNEGSNAEIIVDNTNVDNGNVEQTNSNPEATEL